MLSINEWSAHGQSDSNAGHKGLTGRRDQNKPDIIYLRHKGLAVNSFLLEKKEMNRNLFKNANLKEIGQLRRYMSIIYDNADFYSKHFVNKTIIYTTKNKKSNLLLEEIILCICVE